MTMPKPLTVWFKVNWKILKEMGILDHLSCLLRNIHTGQSVSSVTQSCPALWDPMDRSIPGLPVHHQLQEFTQTHVLSLWYHQNISSSAIPFSSRHQSFPASGSFQMSQLIASGGQTIGVSVSASVLPKNTQDWSPLRWTGWISL